MKRTLLVGSAILFGWLASASVSQAQVFVRAPFVRVAVGDGVAVRAPFVNLYVPPAGPVYYGPYYGPRVIYAPAPIVVQTPPPPLQDNFPAPLPQPVPQTPPPPIKDINSPPPPIAPAQPAQVMDLNAFAKSFQPKAGSYEITLINPVTKQATPVRFSLPEGTPRRVQVTRDSIEFIYGLRQWTRIEFDRDGVQVTSR